VPTRSWSLRWPAPPAWPAWPAVPAVLRRPLLLVAALYPLLRLAVYWPAHWSRQDGDRDVPVYHAAAQRALAGQPLYEPWPDYGPDAYLARYLYPPPFAAALAPTGRLSLLAFERLWYVVLELAYWTYAACLARLATRAWSPWSTSLAALVIQMWPGGAHAMSWGQADPIIWALIGLALVSERARGGMLAGAALIKVYALWPLALAVARERRRVALPAALVGAAAIALGAAVCGWRSYAAWAAMVPNVAGQGHFAPLNVSLSMAGLRAARAVGLWTYAGGPLGAGPRAVLLGASLAGPAAAAWLTRRLEPPLQYAATAAAAVLFAPLCWFLYLPQLLAPLALVVGRRRGDRVDQGLS
jgi:hypothetical protein